MKTCLCLMAAVVSFAFPSRAASEGMLDYVPTAPGYPGSPIVSLIPGTVGWSFQPTTSISVTALGAFNYIVPGVGSLRIGLWDSGGFLLASNSITAGSTLVNASRYGSITPVTLAANETYFLGLYSPGGPVQAIAVVPSDESGGYAVMAGEIQLTGAAWDTSGALVFPTQFGPPGSAIVAPNFEFEVIPEPTSMALFGVGLVAVWRRSKKVDSK